MKLFHTENIIFILLAIAGIPTLSAMEMEENNPTILNVQKNGHGIDISLPVSYPGQEYSSRIIENCKNLILYNSRKLLEQNEKIIEELDQKEQYSFEDLECATKHNPMGLFKDCTGFCCLNRLQTPLLRNTFEDVFIRNIKQKFDKTQQLIITSFAVGGMLPEVIIITKLIEEGYKNLHINLIDPDFKIYFAIKNLSQINKEVAFSKDVFTDKLLKEFNEISQHQDSETLLNNLKGNFCNSSYKLLRFLFWGNKLGANITVSLYGKAEEYITDCIKEPKKKTDVLIGIDYIEEMWNGSLPFLGLALATLKPQGLTCSLVQDPCEMLFRSLASMPGAVINNQPNRSPFTMVITQKNKDLPQDMILKISEINEARKNPQNQTDTKNENDNAENTVNLEKFGFLITKGESEPTTQDSSDTISGHDYFTTQEYWDINNLRRFILKQKLKQIYECLQEGL